MTVMEELDKAHGGQLFRKLGELGGIAPSEAKLVMEALCKPIAARLHDKASEASEFQRLLVLLEDNDTELLKSGDPASADVREDGEFVLSELYGSLEAAAGQARAAAQALRVDAAAVEHLQPIAASLVLAILSSRYRRDAETIAAGDVRPSTAQDTNKGSAAGPAKSGLLAIVLAAMGSAILRALMNRLMPRRRRGTSYGYRSRRRRIRRRREPNLEDLFQDLLR
jgi:hypothetical protein